jgi:hypothetical protein
VRRPERIGIPVQVQARDLGQPRARVELGIRLAGEHLDLVPERVEFPAQVTDVDTLAAAVRLAAIGEQRDPERAIPGNHGLLFRDGLAPMLAPNTVKSYGDTARSPHAMP